MSKRVKAAVMVKPGKIEIHEFPYPELEEGSMVMKMEMSGICGSDKHTYLGFTKQYAGTEAEQETPFPIIPGHENVGIVDRIDKKATKELEFYGKELKEGDRVVLCPDVLCGRCWYCRHIHGWPWCSHNKAYGNAFSSADPPHLFGGWAEYLYVLPNAFVYKVPDGLLPETAVLSEIMSVTYSLDKASEFSSVASEGFNPGNTIVIQGIGPMGLCTLIKARIKGAGNIIAIDGSDYRLKMAKEFSADYTFNINKIARDEIIKIVKDLTDGRGADLIVEATGSAQAVVDGLEMLRRGGMYIIAGNAVDKEEEVSINVARLLCAKNVRLIGMSNHAHIGHFPSMELMEKYKEEFSFDKIISHRYKIEDAEKGLKKSMQPDSMKVVITP